MDLLKSLIVPGAEAYARWASSAFQQPNGNISHLDAFEGRRDSVQESDKSLLLQEWNDINGSSEEDIEDGEIVETTCTEQGQVQSLSTHDVNLIQANKAVSSSNARPNVQERGFRRGSKLCFFWYHYQHCDRDPTNNTNPDKPCSYIHSLDGVQPDVKIAHFPRWMHKGPCGLELCPLKDREWRPKDTSKGKGKPAHEGKSVEVDQVTSMRPNKATNKRKDVMQQKKRKAFGQHPDAPLSSALKRQELSYDDNATKADRDSHGDETCFFWYHDHSRRSQDPRMNYQCKFRHGLTDPPSMVKPPPGYIHHKPCELELCPGDASEEDGDCDKRYFEGKTKKMQVELISMGKSNQE